MMVDDSERNRLPETNSHFENRPKPKRKVESSNHRLSGEL